MVVWHLEGFNKDKYENPFDFGVGIKNNINYIFKQSNSWKTEKDTKGVSTFVAKMNMKICNPKKKTP